jgi:hypothetical protein
MFESKDEEKIERYFKIIIVLLGIQILLTVGLLALNLWLNFKINWFQRESPLID